MNKSDLIKVLSNFLSTKHEAKKSVNLIFDSMTDALSKGEKISISKFGTFYIRISNPRKLVLPKSKIKIISRPRKKVKFKPSSLLINKVNKV